MHFTPVLTAFLFASLAYGQANCGVTSAGDTSAFKLGAIATALASVWDSKVLPIITATDHVALTGLCPVGAAATSSSSQKTTSGTTTPSAVTNPSSSTSTTTSGSGSTGASSGAKSGASKSTTVSVASGTSTLSTTNVRTTTAASASPTESKKSAASQMRGFVGGAGILLLAMILAGF